MQGPMPQVTEHGGGVWSLRVPIPDNPLGHTLVHVLDTDRGPVLVDTGWDDPDSWTELTGGLAALGIDVADIHGVVVTHHHPDHHGLSGKVREASGAWIAMHAADTEVVRRTREAEPGTWLDYLARKLAAVGAPEDHLAPMRAARASGRMRTLPGLRSALPDREIVPGELLDLAGRRLRAIWTPGHTPGHVCLHLEEEHPSRLPGHGQALLRRPSAARDLPAHRSVRGPGRRHRDRSPRRLPRLPRTHRPPRRRRGPPRPSARLHRRRFYRVRELLDHHEERLTGLLGLLATPLTPWQLAVRMEWNRPWEQIPYGSRNIAVSEAEAHLRRLVKLGRAEAVQGTEPVEYVAV